MEVLREVEAKINLKKRTTFTVLNYVVILSNRCRFVQNRTFIHTHRANTSHSSRIHTRRKIKQNGTLIYQIKKIEGNSTRMLIIFHFPHSLLLYT